jgi:hypothetical protein
MRARWIELVFLTKLSVIKMRVVIVRHVSHTTFHRGAAPALETLVLDDTAGDAAQKAVRDARPGLQII